MLRDQVQSFYLPEKTQAHLIWAGKQSRLEYKFPLNIPLNSKVTSIVLNCELCSEAWGYKTDHPSDFSLWVNDQEVGMYTSPGDFGRTLENSSFLTGKMS